MTSPAATCLPDLSMERETRPSYGRSMVSVLIVEDDAAIRHALVRALGRLSHVPLPAGTALDGLQQLLDEHPDVVLLDLNLPDLDGSAALAMIRAVSSVPVIVISARDEENDIVRLLDAGADDYLVKPFSPRQLEARMRAVLRRAAPDQPSAAVVVGGIVIDPLGRTVSLDGEDLVLSPKEFDLLTFLAERCGQVVSKRKLATEVWGQPYAGSAKTVDVHLHWLRRKLGETAREPRYLHGVRGVGVKLMDPTR
jgi:DNA-binding response OmpR family regulator